MESATIAEVLGFKEVSDAISVRPRTLKAVDAWRLFAGEGGVAPAAIALTETGRATEKPLALVVKGDVPELLRSLGV
ncbi:hypothetical protein [Microbacterium sp.]|uniref:hypothetical protein n=1 Tax=Microbacterium sp. TaxID=51671 RepID=UPI003A90FCB7